MNVKALIKPVAVLAAVFVLLLALSAGLAPTAAENAAAEQARLFDTLLPGGAPFTEEAYNGEDTAIAAVHRIATGRQSQRQHQCQQQGQIFFPAFHAFLLIAAYWARI